MSEYRKAPAEVITAIQAAGDAVARLFAGRNVHTLGPSNRGENAGVEIELDIGDYVGQGVYLSWYPGPKVVADAIAALQAGRLDDPSIHLQGQIRESQLGMMIKLLTEEDVAVEEVDDDYRPFAIRVPFRQFSA